MATEDYYPYPSDLDSEGYGSDHYSDWSDVDDDLAGDMSFMSMRSPVPRTPPPKYSSTTSLPGYTAVPMCVVSEPGPAGYIIVIHLPAGGSSRSSSSTAGRKASFRGRTTPSRLPAQVLNNIILNGHRSQRPAASPIQPNRPVCIHLRRESKGCLPPVQVSTEERVKYHLCGKTCKRIAMKSTPLILEAPKGHKTYEMAEQKFQKAWNNVTGPMPPIKKIYKIIENDEFLKPYAIYKQKVGNEHFRYHGTKRQCQLGVTTTKLCSSATCSICNILKTSFKVSLANTGGAFGPGVYSSSASNKAYSYCGTGGAMLLTKVVLGKIKTVQNWNEVMSCPSGYDSVVFDRMNGQLNETIFEAGAFGAGTPKHKHPSFVSNQIHISAGSVHLTWFTDKSCTEANSSQFDLPDSIPSLHHVLFSNGHKRKAQPARSLLLGLLHAIRRVDARSPEYCARRHEALRR
ncbi:hypothetical protein NMY22_g13214 [Coprinellus aureogranulatus]|nr:hypothetical protein NMY22_g13214 [Coprinellus aureogranulatus]